MEFYKGTKNRRCLKSQGQLENKTKSNLQKQKNKTVDTRHSMYKPNKIGSGMES